MTTDVENFDNNENDWITIVEGLQESAITLALEDFDQAGSVDTPEEGIDAQERKDISDILVNTDVPFSLNATGLSWISTTGVTTLGLREGHDVGDTPPTTLAPMYNYLYVRSSEFTNSVRRPTLEVSYTYGAETTVSSTTTYTYDHGMRRVSKTFDATTTLYPTPDYSVEGSTTTVYVTGPSGLVASVKDDGTTSTTQTLHTDHLGSTSVVTDEDGIMVELLDYDPYGTERISWSSSSTSGEAEIQKTYIGEYSDDETGLSYLNARYYDPERGQFLGQDVVYLSLGSGTDKREQIALLDPQMQNSYAYARNNPIKHTDPDGEFLPLLAVAAYMGVQAALSAWDIYSTYETFQDPNSSDTAKALTFGLTVYGLMDPLGGGYTGAGKTVGSGLFNGLRIPNWGNLASLGKHFKDHGAQFGAKNAQDYAQQASDFYRNAGDAGYQRIVGSDGTTRIYDPKTNTFGSYNPDGSTKTFFKPDNGQRYWNNQVNDTKRNVNVDTKNPDKL